MAKIIADRVLETSTTTGTGAYALAGAVTGYRAAAAVCANGDSFDYYAEAVSDSGVPTGDWETGLGTWGTGGTLTRTTIHASSNAGAAVNWAAGVKRIALSLTASGMAGFATIAGVETLTNKTLPSPTLSAPTISDGTAGAIPYLNAGKVLTSGGALGFDGTSLESVGGGIKLRSISDGNTGLLFFYNQAGVNVLQIYGETGLAGFYAPAGVGLKFFANAAEAMCLTGAGLGIGTSSPTTLLDLKAAGTAPAQVKLLGADGATAPAWLHHGVGDYAVLGLNRNPRDGAFSDAAKTSAAIYMNVQSGDSFIGFGTTTVNGGVYSERLRIAGNGHITPGADNTQNVGSGPLRIATLYAGTGTINTSDAREKTAVRPLTAAEIDAAKALAAEIGSYRFLAAVQAKGDAARQHIGMTVQRAIEVMQGFGLDPFGYGFICHDVWADTFEQVQTNAGVKVAKVRLAERQKTAPRQVVQGRVEVRDGVAVQITETVTVMDPVFAHLPVVDTSGAPVMVEDRPATPAVLDNDGNVVAPAQEAVYRQLTHAVPVMEAVEETYEDDAEPLFEQRLVRPAGDRYSFRPDELLLFMARGFEARLSALEVPA